MKIVAGFRSADIATCAQNAVMGTHSARALRRQGQFPLCLWPELAGMQQGLTDTVV